MAGLPSSLHAVLALVVPAQIHFALEALGTNVTSERFEARVLPAVGDEVGALAERFAAHLALVWLFTCRSEITVFVKELQVLFGQNDDNCTIGCGCQ